LKIDLILSESFGTAFAQVLQPFSLKVALAGDSDGVVLANGLLQSVAVLPCELHRIFCGLIVDWR
jgi:hypothetical protein